MALDARIAFLVLFVCRWTNEPRGYTYPVFGMVKSVGPKLPQSVYNFSPLYTYNPPHIDFTILTHFEYWSRITEYQSIYVKHLLLSFDRTAPVLLMEINA